MFRFLRRGSDEIAYENPKRVLIAPESYDRRAAINVIDEALEKQFQLADEEDQNDELIELATKLRTLLTVPVIPGRSS